MSDTTKDNGHGALAAAGVPPGDVIKVEAGLIGMSILEPMATNGNSNGNSNGDGNKDSDYIDENLHADVFCSACGGGESSSKNKIVGCDHCRMLHQYTPTHSIHLFFFSCDYKCILTICVHPSLYT
jgi:hypothetical protein